MLDCKKCALVSLIVLTKLSSGKAVPIYFLAQGISAFLYPPYLLRRKSHLVLLLF